MTDHYHYHHASNPPPTSSSSSSSSSYFGGHRRGASHGNPPEALPLPPQGVGPAAWINNGLTPAFELYDDPLSAPLPTAVIRSSSHVTKLQGAPHNQSIDNGSFSSSTTGRAGGKLLVTTQQQQQPPPPPPPHHDIHHHRHPFDGWISDEYSVPQPSVSPLLSTDQGHTTHARVSSPSMDMHRRALTPTVDCPSSPLQHQQSFLTRQGSQPQRKSGTRGGGSGDSYAPLKSPTVRASPLLFRTGSRAGREDVVGRSRRSDDDTDDEEAGKGHGRGGAATAKLRRKSTGGSAIAEQRSAGRASSRATSRARFAEDICHGDDGRRTPAQYRPEKHAGKSISPPPAARRTSSPYHSYVSMDDSGADMGQTEPLVVPQARRGAINLRTSKKVGSHRKEGIGRGRRTKKGPRPPPRPFWVSVGALVIKVCWQIAHPAHTVVQGKAWVLQTIVQADQAFRHPDTGRRIWWPDWLGAYIPLLIWLVVSLSSTIIVLTFHTQVFQGLDNLSRTLQRMGVGGKVIIGALIFLTTFPPLPLYSTLIILCGFSFGLWQGFVISYIAALSGAVVVYLLSKSLLQGWMEGLLSKSGGLKKVVRAIEKRPKLLFLIRLAPYPYNLMNTLLASSPTLTFKTYFLCTALALPKLMVHCALGASIKNFAAYHGASKASHNSAGVVGSGSDSEEDQTTDQSHTSTAETAKRVAGFIGIGLCLGIFIYLLSVARKAVDEEVGSDEEGDDDDEEEEEEEEDEDDEGGGDYLDGDSLLSEYIVGEAGEEEEGSDKNIDVDVDVDDRALLLKGSDHDHHTLPADADAVTVRIASPETVEMKDLFPHHHNNETFSVPPLILLAPAPAPASASAPSARAAGDGGRRGGGVIHTVGVVEVGVEAGKGGEEWEGQDHPYRQDGDRSCSCSSGRVGGRGSGAGAGGEGSLERETFRSNGAAKLEIDFMEEEAERSLASVKADGWG